MEIIYEYVKLTCLILIVYMIGYNIYTAFPKSKTNIRDIATRNLAVIGRYDYRTTISVRFWIYSIEVAVYNVKPDLNLLDVLRAWNTECNIDDESLIYKGIEEAHTLFLKDLDTARENNTPVTFHVSYGYDYHLYPKSFMYNDYIDPDSLLERVDKILEEEQSE